MKWNQLEGIVNKIANKNRVKPNVVKKIIEHIFYSIRLTIKNKDIPKVLIHNFGTFRSKSSIINRKIETLKKAYKAGKVSEEKYNTELENYQKTFKRLKDEGF